MAVRSVLLLLALCGIATPARAQAVLLDAVTRAQGSPSDYVADAIQTRDGFFWLATDAGVARYDGRDFVVWSAADGLPHDYANVLLELPSGAVAVGTYGGAAIVEEGRVRRMPGTRQSVGGLGQDRFGRLYIVSSTGVEVCDDAGDAVRVRCRTLVVDQTFGVGGAVETSGGVLRVVLAGGRVAVLRPSAQGVAVTQERVAMPDGMDAAATDRGGLSAFGAAGVRLFDGDNSSTLALGPDGRAWTIPGRLQAVLRRGTETVVGTNTGEIWRVDPSRGAARIAGAADTGGYPVNALVGDYEGGLWAGFFGGGLRRVEAGGLVLHRRRDPALARATLRLSRDPDGTLWLTTREGLVRRGPRGEVETVARTGLGLTTGAPGGGRYASTGTSVVLAGAGGAAAMVLSDGNWISSLLVGAGDTLWVGTYGSGVRRVVGAREVAAAAGAPEIVEAFAPGAGGAVWALTRSEGAARYRAGRWTAVREGLPSGAVFSLLDETDGPNGANGALWLGTDRGLVRRRGSAQTVFDDGGRLRGQRIHALFRTHADTLWVVADRQIHALVGERLVAFGRLRLRAHEGVAIHAAVGVPGERRVFLGTSEGLVEIDLAAMAARSRRRASPFSDVRSSDAKATTPAAAPPDTIRLAPGARRVTLAFAPLTFGSDVAARVQYQMADGPWSGPTPERGLALRGPRRRVAPPARARRQRRGARVGRARRGGPLRAAAVVAHVARAGGGARAPHRRRRRGCAARGDEEAPGAPRGARDRTARTGRARPHLARPPRPRRRPAHRRPRRPRTPRRRSARRQRSASTPSAARCATRWARSARRSSPSSTRPTRSTTSGACSTATSAIRHASTRRPPFAAPSRARAPRRSTPSRPFTCSGSPRRACKTPSATHAPRRCGCASRASPPERSSSPSPTTAPFARPTAPATASPRCSRGPTRSAPPSHSTARPAGRTSRCGGLPTTDPVCAAGSPEQAKRRPRRRP